MYIYIIRLRKGETVKHGHDTYKITGITSFEEMNLVNIINKCKETGKECYEYHAARILKNGTLSKKEGISFLRFVENGKIIVM